VSKPIEPHISYAAIQSCLSFSYYCVLLNRADGLFEQYAIHDSIIYLFNLGGSCV